MTDHHTTMSKLHITGLVLALLPWAWWAFDTHHDPCGPTGEAWQQCRAHHQGPHKQLEPGNG